MIFLKPLSQDYAPELFNFEQANKAWFEQWVPPRPNNYQTLAGVQELIDHQLKEMETSRDGMWLGFEKGRLIGRFNLVHLCAQTAEVGYRIGQDCGGNGFAKQGLLLLIKEATDRHFEELVAQTTPENFASQKVLNFVGFVRRPSGDEKVAFNEQEVTLLSYRLGLVE